MVARSVQTIVSWRFRLRLSPMKGFDVRVCVACPLGKLAVNTCVTWGMSGLGRSKLFLRNVLSTSLPTTD